MPLRTLALASASSAALLLTASPALAATHHHRRPACRGAHTPTNHASPRVIKQAVVCLINRERREHGLPALRTSRRLNQSAQGWTNQMVRTHDFLHADYSERISATGFHWSTAGENIATGFETPSQVVTGWMGSPGHCQNILDPDYASVGTGVVDRVIGPDHLGKATWTQDFGTTMGTRDPSDNWGPADSVC
jgi:uncharacterized protein YkwD